MSTDASKRRVLGWREWVSLPCLGIATIKAKLDTGAKTSALHAWDLSHHTVDGRPWLRFRVSSKQRNKDTSVECEAPISDERWVTNSSGMGERRYIITTDLKIGPSSWPIELSLTDRGGMEFPMIIGREAMRERLLVDPMASYLAGRRRKRTAAGLVQDEDDAKARGVVN